MWQSGLGFLDIITMLSLAMQIQSDGQFKSLQQQIDRIEHKLDTLILLYKKEG